MLDWSTDDIAPRDRFSYWRELVCQSVFDITTETKSADFSAQIKGRSAGDIRLISFDCTEHEIVRDQRQAERNPEDYYVVSLNLRGHSIFSQNDTTFALNPHEIVIVDGRLPFRMTFADAVSRAVAVVPRDMIDSRAPWLPSQPRQKISPVSEYADLARRHLHLLSRQANDLTNDQIRLLTESLCNLLALATNDFPTNRLSPAVQLEAVQAYCRRNLNDTELSPKQLAARFGISVRTLHSRFEKTGQSFGQWLLENRLVACAQALRDPQRKAVGISDMAYAAGFNDLSHFNRTFRARFGMSPREWRSAPADSGTD